MTNVNQWKAIYEPGLLKRKCRKFNSYIVLTSPSAWRAVEQYLPCPPAEKIFVTGQEEDYLADLAQKLPQAERVLAIGGGMALDAGKYVAWKKKLPLVMIPTIVSTGAVFNPGVPARRNGKLCLIEKNIQPECVLFDTDIIGAAPAHLNAAGMAESICWLGNIASWRWWTNEKLGSPAWDDEIAAEVIDWVRDSVRDYTDDLNAQGRPGPRAIQTAAEVNRERHHLKFASMNAFRGLGHIFDNTFVWIHRRDLAHGQAVALGTLMGCHLYSWGFDEAKQDFCACGTRFRPAEIGCTWDEVRTTLSRVVEHAEHLKYLNWPKNYFHHRSIGVAAFREMAARIDAA